MPTFRVRCAHVVRTVVLDDDKGLTKTGSHKKHLGYRDTHKLPH